MKKYLKAFVRISLLMLVLIMIYRIHETSAGFYAAATLWFVALVGLEIILGHETGNFPQKTKNMEEVE